MDKDDILDQFREELDRAWAHDKDEILRIRELLADLPDYLKCDSDVWEAAIRININTLKSHSDEARHDTLICGHIARQDIDCLKYFS